MDIIILKSFIPEIFLSIAIFSQLIFNVRIINNIKFNFPIINKELFSQVSFILMCLFCLFLNLKIEGFNSNFLFFNDGGVRVVKLLLVISSLLILVYVFQSFISQRLNFFEYFSIFLFSIFSSLLLLSSSDLMSAYLSIEIQSLCFYILASFRRNSAFSTEAGLKYFISGSFISCVFLFGCSLVYGSIGTLNFNHITTILSFPFLDEFFFVKLTTIIGSLLIIFTLFFKVSAVPFHFWSPDVYEGSPLSSTIIFSVLPKLVIFTFLIKWILTISDIFFYFQDIFLIVGIASTFLGTFFALKQKRIKRLIIYSSIAQVGFLVAALYTNSVEGLFSVYFFLIIYIITSILLWGHFSFISFFSWKISSFFLIPQSPLFISSLSNLYKANKIWAISFLVILFSIAGIPPFSGFLSKVFIMLNLIESSHIISAITLIVLSSISVFYYIRIIKIIFFELIELKKSKNKALQLIIDDNYTRIDLGCLIFSILLFLLIFFFFYPTFLLLLCQYLVLSLIGY